MEKYDLLKIPDEIIIQELKLVIRRLKVESGKDKAYIQELEEIASKAAKYKKNLEKKSAELEHLLNSQKELKEVHKEFKEEENFKLRYNKLRIEYNNLQRQLTACLTSKLKDNG